MKKQKLHFDLSEFNYSLKRTHDLCNVLNNLVEYVQTNYSVTIQPGDGDKFRADPVKYVIDGIVQPVMDLLNVSREAAFNLKKDTISLAELKDKFRLFQSMEGGDDMFGFKDGKYFVTQEQEARLKEQATIYTDKPEAFKIIEHLETIAAAWALLPESNLKYYSIRPGGVFKVDRATGTISINYRRLVAFLNGVELIDPTAQHRNRPVISLRDVYLQSIKH